MAWAAAACESKRDRTVESIHMAMITHSLNLLTFVRLQIKRADQNVIHHAKAMDEESTSQTERREETEEKE